MVWWYTHEFLLTLLQPGCEWRSFCFFCDLHLSVKNVMSCSSYVNKTNLELIWEVLRLASYPLYTAECHKVVIPSRMCEVKCPLWNVRVRLDCLSLRKCLWLVCLWCEVLIGLGGLFLFDGLSWCLEGQLTVEKNWYSL